MSIPLENKPAATTEVTLPNGKRFYIEHVSILTGQRAQTSLVRDFGEENVRFNPYN